MAAFTGVVQTGAATAANLGTLLRAAGYTGSTRPTMLLFDNPSTTVPIYIHFTSSSSAAPGTGTAGIPISSAAFPARRNLELLAGTEGLGADLNHTWIYAASDVPLTVAVAGA